MACSGVSGGLCVVGIKKILVPVKICHRHNVIKMFRIVSSMKPRFYKSQLHE
jgi:hypothetical protein